MATYPYTEPFGQALCSASPNTRPTLFCISPHFLVSRTPQFAQHISLPHSAVHSAIRPTPCHDLLHSLVNPAFRLTQIYDVPRSQILAHPTSHTTHKNERACKQLIGKYISLLGQPTSQSTQHIGQPID